MAELVVGPFLSAFLQVAFERLASSDIKEFFRGSKLKDGLLKKLDITLNSINQVLEDAEEKQYKSSSVKKWLDELKDAVYEAEQLLDEIATEASRQKLEAEFETATSKVLGFFPAFINSFESRIKEVLENLEFLAKQKDELGLRRDSWAGNEVRGSWKLSKRLPTTSLVDESSIYGRDGDKEDIIRLLVSDNVSGNRVPLIAIVGMGGLGKTTLAQLVYNDHRMEDEFDFKAWVHVSENFDVVGVMKAILMALHSSAEGKDLNQLQLELKQRLMGKKFLLVLDDIWNEIYERWEVFQVPFNYGSSGSKVLVTTRSVKVASVMNSTQLLHLKPLEDHDGWSVFMKHAFQDKNASEYPNLESIGKEIVAKCGGLPLAIKTLGNLLRTKFSEQEWAKILKTDMWHLLEDDSSINPALRSSYHKLPSNLKRCVAYLFIFPKGYRFRKDELIQLWMAEGLLNCGQTNKSEEELGNEFFNDLEMSSFFQQSEDDFIMHDLLHDLAKSVSEKFCLRIEDDKVEDIPKSTRHIWCSHRFKDGDKILEHICKCTGLRTLMPIRWQPQAGGLNINVQHVLFSKLKYLRVLSFSACYLTELAEDISNLKLLRYLNLSDTRIKRLPDSICKLHNLQTLKLALCYFLTELPSGLYKLVNLRHLDLRGSKIKKMPEQMGSLKHLRTLADFVVGMHSGSDIRRFKLEELVLCSGHLSSSQSEMMWLRGEGIKSLERMRWSSVTRFLAWLGSFHLPNLVSIVLGSCKFCFCLPPLGQLPSLKELSISCFNGIEVIGPEFYGNNSSNVPFRSLETLEFYGMSVWEKWICFEGHNEGEGFPCLKELSISRCPRLKRDLPRRLPSLQNLVIKDCPQLESFPEGGLPLSLGQLEIRDCPKLIATREEWGLFKLHSLKEFTVSDDFENVETFPEERLLPPTLRHLRLERCKKLRTINYRGLLHLKSLESLYIEICRCLECLPEEGLPNSLSTLSIRRCPLLKQRYQKEEGEHRHKIRHIPSVYFR